MITLESLGFTQEELQQRVVDQLCETAMARRVVDNEHGDNYMPSDVRKQLDKLVKDRCDEKIKEIADKFILPNVAHQVETLVIQKTNQYGEKTGEPVTFIEYLTKRAEQYLMEEVDHDGKTKEESRGGYWNKNQTRITYLINSHLEHHIGQAMKNALALTQEGVGKALLETAKIKLNEFATGIKLSVEAVQRR